MVLKVFFNIADNSCRFDVAKTLKQQRPLKFHPLDSDKKTHTRLQEAQSIFFTVIMKLKITIVIPAYYELVHFVLDTIVSDVNLLISQVFTKQWRKK